VQDQKAVGCTGTDTVDQCMDKLYEHWLVETAHLSGGRRVGRSPIAAYPERLARQR
jgi:hypothetical protein